MLATSDEKFLMYRYVNLLGKAEWILVIAIGIIYIGVYCSLKILSLYKWIRLTLAFIFIKFRFEWLIIIKLFKTWWRL